MAARPVYMITILLATVYSLQAIDMDDPCLTRKRLNDWRRSVNFKISSQSNNYLCDKKLVEGWYRITSCAGDKMTTFCPVNSYTCNTHAPIWLTSKNIGSGAIYPVNGEVVTRSYCASWELNCCRYVYYLTQPKWCSLAYCFGEKVPYNLNLSHPASTEDQSGCMGFQVDGIWTDWAPWTTCTATCGRGITSRNRTCTTTEPNYNDFNCTGNDKEQKQCNIHYCPIDGNWTNWAKWTACSVSCGGGIESRDRTCTNPKPDYNGLNCSGSSIDKRLCKIHNCPVHGNWTDWAQWMACSVSCNGGITSRNRTCTNPKPNYNGLNCTGNSTDDRPCNVQPCPIYLKESCDINIKAIAGVAVGCVVITFLMTMTGHVIINKIRKYHVSGKPKQEENKERFETYEEMEISSSENVYDAVL